MNLLIITPESSIVDIEADSRFKDACKEFLQNEYKPRQKWKLDSALLLHLHETARQAALQHQRSVFFSTYLLQFGTKLMIMR